MVAVDPPVVTFAGLLRHLRTEAGLSQQELATAAGVGARTVSDLERGVALTARKDTARLLAGALNLTGAARASFEAVARGRALAGTVATASAGSGGMPAAVQALPRDIGTFTGRRSELHQLVTTAADAAGSTGVVAIHAIGGMAGVGKTAFAVHAAYQLAPRFPDGQIFLSLHGHTSGRQPVDPADALASLLLTMGVTAGQIPAGVEARMALWRDRLAGKQLLLLLDDAAGSEQVRPLLPGSAGSLVLVTSRRHLTALEDTTAITLDTLPPAEAAALLVRLAGRPELSPADPAVAEIIALCGYLPLAIGLLGRQLHHHPSWTAADLAADLAATQDRLHLLHAENLSVTAAFNLSYDDLTPDQQRLFRRLGLHVGTDIDAYAAAALDGTDLEPARRRLQALYDQYLLTEPVHGRYRQHDLIREHARALADRVDSDRDRDQATVRLLDYYQHAASLANVLVARQTGTAPVSAHGAPPVAVPALTRRDRALAWVRAERANLIACLDRATRTGQHDRVVTLTAALSGLLRHDGPWAEAVTRHAAAAAAARRCHDRPGEASALRDLGVVRWLTDDYQNAARDLAEALGIYRQLGDRLGQANALASLGDVWRLTDDYPSAARDLAEALGIYRQLGDRLGQANALASLGDVWRLTDDCPSAIRDLAEALGIYRELDDRLGQANALNYLGGTREQAGDYPGAVRDLREALSISRTTGDLLRQVGALTSLGQAGQATGDLSGATRDLEEALGLSRSMGDRLGQANALHYLGAVRRRADDYQGAARDQRQALAIYRDFGDRLGQAGALAHLGGVLRAAGDLSGAAQALEEALGIYRDLGDRDGEALTLNETGTLRRISGEPSQAASCHQQALDLTRQIDDSRGEAHALAGLGRCARATGRVTEAEDLLRQAREIFRRIGAVEAAEVSAELAAIRGQAAEL